MAAQKGSDIIIRLGSATASPTTFSALAGLRSKTVSLNAEQVDISSADSVNKWRELLAGAGLKNASISGSGVFKDATVEADLRTEFFAQRILTYQIEIPSFCIMEGAFQLTQLQYAGEHNGETTWDISLESAGEITAVAV